MSILYSNNEDHAYNIHPTTSMGSDICWFLTCCRTGCTGPTNWDCFHCVNYKVYNDTDFDSVHPGKNYTGITNVENTTTTSSKITLKTIILNATTVTEKVHNILQTINYTGADTNRTLQEDGDIVKPLSLRVSHPRQSNLCLLSNRAIYL